MQSKVPFIEDIITSNNQLFIGLSETWLKLHKDAELAVNGYTLFRADRKRYKKSNRGRDSGGTAFYIRNDIASTCDPLLTFSNGVIEVLCIYSRVENIMLICLYRQPDDKAHGHSSTVTEWSNAISKLKGVLTNINQPTPDIIMGGDFNIPHIDWSTGIPSSKCTKDAKEIFSVLNEFANEFQLKQYVQESTHKDGNTLDLLFTNNDMIIHDLQCTKTLNSITHHCLVETLMTYKSNVQRYRENKQQVVQVLDHSTFSMMMWNGKKSTPNFSITHGRENSEKSPQKRY